MMIKMNIYSNFDSGNIQIESADSPDDIRLTIPADNQSDFYQWFHFRLESETDQEHNFTITNLAKSAYPEGWKNYHVVVSYDRQDWFRIPTEFDGDNLMFQLTPEFGSVYFAYFAPYSYERHTDLLYQAQTHPLCRLETLGQSIDGHDISLLTFGQAESEKPHLWIIGRQHPGESMAEWFIEGLLGRLLDETDTLAKALLDNAVLHIVPNMNPDGSVRGHLRTNALGVNLNREWQSPSMEKSPEVCLVRQRMLETGVDLFLDIHGDEAIPYNFVSGSEGVPGYDARMAALENAFKSALLTVTAEFQDQHGYDKDQPGKANLTVASNWVNHQFKCLSYTIEMPFKDNIAHPDEHYGWSPERSAAFGADTLSAVWAVLGQLR